MNIFVYGTLMLPEVWQQIVHQTYKQETAILHNYERRKIIGEVYPAITPHEGADVEGIVYFNVDAIDIQRLDVFEGEEYQRNTIQITTSKGEHQTAATYLYKSRFWHKLSDKIWDFDEFIENGKDKFLHDYKGWNAVELKHI